MIACANHTAFVYDRGGRQQITQIKPLTSVKWGRSRDDMSGGEAFAENIDADCASALDLAEAGRHELVIFRGGVRVWEGPMTLVARQGNSIQIKARDVMYYVNRTIMRNEYDNRYPNTGLVLDRIKRVMTAEVARWEAQDPSANILAHVKYLYADGTTTIPHRQYDATPVKSAVDQALTLPALQSALAPMMSAYGITNYGIPAVSAYANTGLSWTNVTIAEGSLKGTVKAALDALAVYPPSFIKATGVTGLYFVKGITGPVNSDVGAFAHNGAIHMGTDHFNTSPVTTSEYMFHHEVNHVAYTTFGAAVAGGFTESWMALNPVGFAYNTDYTEPSFTGTHPVGFVRNFARHSLREDVAETAAIIFTSSRQADLRDMLTLDPTIRAKVELLKEWLSARSAGVMTFDYFRAIHTPGGVTQTSASTDISDARTAAHTLPYELTVFEHLDSYAARGGLDYTVIGRSILFFDVHKVIGMTPMVTDDDFLEPPIITQYGSELTTYVAMTDGKGNYGDAGGSDPYYGMWEKLHQAYDENAAGADENNIPTVAEMRSQAVRAYQQGKVPPMVVRVPDNTSLNPNGVLTLEDLVPGVHIPLSAKMGRRTLSQTQKLDRMTVSESAEEGETISVVMSPAIAESFVDEE